MLRILATPRKGGGMTSHISCKCCTVCGRVPRVASLTVLRVGGELKTVCVSSQKKLTFTQVSD